MIKQCSSCGGFKDSGHRCPVLDPPARVTIEDREYIVPHEVAVIFQAVSEERDELKAQVDRLTNG